ncbi:hypothetical protein TNIN_134721 [Trichonephila inaurata madagascariensis]|uniref:Uncharacterized protein n=1 Tax=Trichonephila inaurata madagascariensis TaxID=2747483 RepID=A0A8X7CMQ7_9ARAC|nr:hypothetical protein TNIN_134721 [Trichonephila inaurata madagascariensis]
MTEASFAALYFQNNAFNLTTDIRNVGRLPRNRYVLQTLIGPPNFAAGNDTSRKSTFYPLLLLVRCSLQHFSSPFGALTCTSLKASTRSR